ncbi:MULTISPECIES: DUF6358 family protein [Desertivirga]|jgi:hypothetical protein|uniref:DUF6358 family protein n=1 Tax=Desertivirga TaxID=3153690 RepID=UPI001A95CF6B|nr:DUF6358 family protein [Pedobacter sp. SYSU D00823]
MTGKIILNVVYNLAIFAFGLCLVWGIKHTNYLVVATFAAAIALIVYFKLRLIKQVKEYARSKKK